MTVLWDWNGTLLDDTQASVDALNELLQARGLPAVTLESHRAQFAFPARTYYARLGMDLAREDWPALAQAYHDAYRARPAALAADARAALSEAREAGCRQAILSAMRQDYLEEAVERYGLREFFDALVGTDNLDGGSKLERARAFFASAPDDSAPTPGTHVLIGDSLHDAEVAAELGIGCVLYSGGSHSRERLARVAPTCDSLLDCIRFIILQRRRHP